MLLSVRVAGDPEDLVGTIRAALTSVDRNLETALISAVARDVERGLIREKLLSRLSVFFAALAAALAALGVYGLMSHAVASRTREIGIRMAIGAQTETVLGGELRAALQPVGIGIGLGIFAAFGARGLIASQLFGVSITDPAAVLIAIALLTSVAALAAFLPARRASRVDPTIALRHE
jgi:ABC-type antimicrobial peptide transport system permease subunit